MPHSIPRPTWQMGRRFAWLRFEERLMSHCAEKRRNEMQVCSSHRRERLHFTLTMVVSPAGWWQQNLSRKLMAVSVLSQVPSDRMRGKGLMLCHRKYRLDIRKNFFMELVVKNWNRLPKELVELPPLKVLKKHVDLVLEDVF